MATVGTPLKGKRLHKKLEKEAASMILNFQTVAQDAAEAEIKWVINILRMSPKLMYNISGMMKDEGFVGLLDGTLVHDVDLATPPKKRKVAEDAEHKKLRTTMKRFKHLTQTNGLCSMILKAVAGDEVFGLTEAEMVDQVGLMCLIAGAQRETLLPMAYDSNIITQGDLVAAFVARYKKIGRPLTGVKKEVFMQGVYSVNSSLAIECLYDKAPEKKTIELEDVIAVEITDRFVIKTTAAVTLVSGMTLLMTDLDDSFEELGVTLPDPNFEWGTEEKSTSPAASASCTAAALSCISAKLAKPRASTAALASLKVAYPWTLSGALKKQMSTDLAMI